MASKPNGGEKEIDATVAHIVAALQGLRFGQVVVTVQDGVVVQIDRTGRRRIARAS